MDIMTMMHPTHQMQLRVVCASMLPFLPFSGRQETALLLSASACEACSTRFRRVLSRQEGHQMPPLIDKLHCRAGFAQVHFRKVEPHESHERRRGQEYFAVWTRKAEA